MKEAAPRIFRSLEKPQGPGDFNTIVAAAVAAYGSLRAPSERQARDLGRLIGPLWQHVSTETRRALSASLSHTPRMPRNLIDLLVASPVEVAAPFLVSSPTLSVTDLQRLVAEGDERVARIVAGRQARAIAPALETVPAIGLDSAAQALKDQDPAGATSGRGRSLPQVDAPSLSPDFLAQTPLLQPRRAAEPAGLVRETLRHLARTGHQRPDGMDAVPSLAILVDAAMERDAPRFYKTLGRMLGIGSDRLHEIAADEDGRQLAAALKALRAGPADALSILMMLKPEIGLDVMAFDRMARHYRGIDALACRELFAASLERPKRAAGPTSFERELRLVEAAGGGTSARAQFGRRKVRPAERQRDSGSGSS